MIDIWRSRNPTSKEYTFFSNRHKSHSRLDLIFISRQLSLVTKKVEILLRVILDHNPVLWIGKNLNSTYQWRLNEQLLSQEDNLEKIIEETRNFFKCNLGTEVPIQCVWDAYKAYMRGILMKMNFERRGKKEKMIKEIQTQIRCKELELIKNPNLSSIQLEIAILQNKIQNIMQEEMQKNMKFMKQKYFASADKNHNNLSPI